MASTYYFLNHQRQNYAITGAGAPGVLYPVVWGAAVGNSIIQCSGVVDVMVVLNGQGGDTSYGIYRGLAQFSSSPVVGKTVTAAQILLNPLPAFVDPMYVVSANPGFVPGVVDYSNFGVAPLGDSALGALFNGFFSIDIDTSLINNMINYSAIGLRFENEALGIAPVFPLGNQSRNIACSEPNNIFGCFQRTRVPHVDTASLTVNFNGTGALGNMLPILGINYAEDSDNLSNLDVRFFWQLNGLPGTRVHSPMSNNFSFFTDINYLATGLLLGTTYNWGIEWQYHDSPGTLYQVDGADFTTTSVSSNFASGNIPHRLVSSELI